MAEGDGSETIATAQGRRAAAWAFLLVATWAAHTSDLPHPTGTSRGRVDHPTQAPRDRGGVPHIRSARVDRLAARCSP